MAFALPSNLPSAHKLAAPEACPPYPGQHHPGQERRTQDQTDLVSARSQRSASGLNASAGRTKSKRREEPATKQTPPRKAE